MVAFTDGNRDKKRMRLFKVRGRADDYSAMREVLTRHYTKAKERDDLPDLLIVDGGKGQLSVALDVLKELNIASVDLLAVTKEEGRHDKGLTKERVFMADRPEPIALDPQSSLLFFLQQVRDEAHRVAISFQRKRRTKTLIKSELDEIPSIGPKKKAQLLQHFGSVKRIKEASYEELLEVEGITKANAQTIKEFFASK
jgi:excinuclease ABC subunit C